MEYQYVRGPFARNTTHRTPPSLASYIRGGKEKEWTDCVQSDIRAFGIAGDWKVTTLKAEVWVETVTEGGRRFMAAWRKEEVDATRHRQEKREATRLGNLLSQTGVV